MLCAGCVKASTMPFYDALLCEAIGQWKIYLKKQKQQTSEQTWRVAEVTCSTALHISSTFSWSKVLAIRQKDTGCSVQTRDSIGNLMKHDHVLQRPNINCCNKMISICEMHRGNMLGFRLLCMRLDQVCPCVCCTYKTTSTKAFRQRCHSETGPTVILFQSKALCVLIFPDNK